MKPLAILLSLWLAFPAMAQTPPKPPDVILPNPPTPIVPIPNPATPALLSPNQFYVIQASAPVIVLASPDGVVKITSEAGPLRMRGIFCDGTGATETRTFKEPNLYIVEAVGQGTCELIVVSSMSPATVIRRTLTTGTAPPPTPTDPLVQSLSDALKADGQPVTVAASLARVYRAVAASTVNNTAIATYADLFGQVKTLQDAAVPSASIPKLRAVLGQQFTAAFGTTGTAPINRALAATTFNTLAAALEGVSK